MSNKDKLAILYRSKGKLWRQFLVNVHPSTASRILTGLREQTTVKRDEVDYLAIPMDYLPKPAPRMIHVNGANVKNWLPIQRACQRKKRL